MPSGAAHPGVVGLGRGVPVKTRQRPSHASSTNFCSVASTNETTSGVAITPRFLSRASPNERLTSSTPHTRPSSTVPPDASMRLRSTGASGL
eukprot:scaffold63612_cov32-Tisochrysis_lutea.AAC.2